MSEKNKIVELGRNHFKMRFFMLLKLPLAFFAGLKVTEIDNKKASISIPFKFLNKNPFQSIYFAALSMAAELSTGILAMAAIAEIGKPVSMLVLEMNGKFIKKAKTKIVFTCLQGSEILETVKSCIETSEGKIIQTCSKGFDLDGNQVAEFYFTWTFKAKSNNK